MDPYRHLPDDLLPGILSRLPVKSLLRFRSVSKPWLALVDDGDFALSRLKNFKNNSDETRLLVVQNRIDGQQEYEVRCSDTFKLIPEILPLSETFNPGHWLTIFSIDGLILLQSVYYPPGYYYFRDLKVWNPSIGKLLEIPPLVEPSSRVWNEDMGFGYDQVANDYKIVKLIFHGCKNKLHSVAVYPLRAGSWRIIDFQSFDWHWDTFMNKEVVYFRGSLYFHGFYNKGEGSDLVWFDLSKEEFSYIRIPDGPCIYSRPFYYWTLVSVDGGLTMEARGRCCTYMYVWATDTEFMCWNKPQIHSLKDRHIYLIKKKGDMLTWRPVCGEKVLDKNGKERLVEKSEVGSYNCEREEYKILQIDTRKSLVSFYVESLILHR